MIELTTQKIAEVTGSTLINDVDPQAVVTGPAEFDSRKITPGAIFMALPGARADGHDFADAALQNGAALLIVGRQVEQPALLAAPVEVNEQTSNATAFEFDVEGHGAAVLAAVDKLARYNTDVLAA